jgi:hypothetical protein
VPVAGPVGIKWLMWHQESRLGPTLAATGRAERLHALSACNKTVMELLHGGFKA